MEGYTANIEYASKELTARERLKLKDTTAAIALDEAVTPEIPVTVEIDYWGIVEIHNERSKGDSKDYNKIVIVGVDGNMYVTGSASFQSALDSIMQEMGGETDRWELMIYKRESKNYKGKYFLTCTVA